MITREAIDAFPATSANYADIFRLIGEFESLLQFDEICLGLSKRVAVAVSAEWQTVEDSVRFWSADYGDDQLTKLLLMKKLQLAQQAVLWIRSRIRSDSKLFAGSGVGVGVVSVSGRSRNFLVWLRSGVGSGVGDPE